MAASRQIHPTSRVAAGRCSVALEADGSATKLSTLTNRSAWSSLKPPRVPRGRARRVLGQAPALDVTAVTVRFRPGTSGERSAVTVPARGVRELVGRHSDAGDDALAPASDADCYGCNGRRRGPRLGARLSCVRWKLQRKEPHELRRVAFLAAEYALERPPGGRSRMSFASRFAKPS